jgi:hypothetical protein
MISRPTSGGRVDTWQEHRPPTGSGHDAGSVGGMHVVAVLALDGVVAFDLAGMVGFGSAVTFRDRFRGLVGTSPQAYRRAFRDRVS